MRSKLFVPGSRPELFPKALDGPADALSFDLEDAVAEDRKAEARTQVGALLRSAAAQASGKTLIVRVNAIDTPHFEADVAAVACEGLHLLNLPKAESIEQVMAAVAALETAERANGVTRPARLLLNVESPRGLRQAAAMAQAHARVAGLQLGFGDLFEPLGIARRDIANVHAAMFAMRLAAGEAGVFAYDSAFADVKDAEGYLAEAEMARRLGYLGKSCIHPSQVALAHRVFRPSEADIARALCVTEAAREAQARGVGAYLVDGRMVDAPFVRSAEAIVADAKRLGLLPER
ncbi:citrate lyase subunit beta / citryl-CoA lyase [Variovorax sp. CF079]|uniref:HpcH/HpaI aldolase/citrate lyase family protein n=1 Tax=Variovorax sp. CF079 TaxID=1882774 RepID=UPI00088ED3AB|nr:CoA ester lyase [Variovorax sp. CF079]SDC27984.1 citrate lyase subunit beta / citryl-CoA lyase [Variovorax sp. CF079]